MWLGQQRLIFCFLNLCSFMVDALAQDADESWLAFIPNKYKADGSRPVFVRSFSENGTSADQVPVKGISFALSYDLEGKKIYLSVRELGKWSTDIQRANIDGTELTTVVSMAEGKTFLAGIALDWITKNLYYTDTSRWQVGVCNPMSKECATLVDDPMNQPFRIALHPQTGTMFWTTRGETPGIFKASMDGSNPTRIISKGVIFPGSITIDHALSRLYWDDKEVETIYTSDLNGANVTPLKSLGSTRIKAWHCTVGGPNIYWLDADEESIKKCNKNDGNSFAVEQKGLGKAAILFDMTFIGPGSQPNDRVNHCADDPCPHICVLTETSYRCLCPEGLTVSQDGLRCEDVGHKMLITSSGGTHLLSMTNFQMTTLANFSSSWGLSYDLQQSKIYWAGGPIGSMIFRSNLDGTGIQSVVTIPGGKPITGLAYDWIAHNIYYTNQIHVGVCDVHGKICLVIIHDPKNSPLRIHVFPRAGLMFYTTQGRISSMTRANMDGTSPRRIIRAPFFKLGFTIDKEESRLFWLQRSDSVETSDLEWRERRKIRPIRNQLVSLDVGGDLLYWMDNEMIQSCNKKTQTDLTVVKEFKWNETVFEMRLFHPEGQLQDRINHCAGGLCSHICVLTKKYFRCICPSNMNLMEDGWTCTAEGAFRNQTTTPVVFTRDKHNGGRLGSHGKCKSWTCADGTCVGLEDVCNGTLGCSDGTDEGLHCEIPCNKIRRTDEKDCIRTPNGPQILCPPGFQLSSDGTACKDIDECLEKMCLHYCFNTNGSYECRDNPEGIDPLTVALAATVPTIVAIAVICIALYFGFKYIQARKILRSLTPEEIQEFLDGDEHAAKTADYGAEKALLMPFRLVIPPDSINIAKDAILGSGQFGVVYRGFHGAEAVAVKTFKRTVEIDEFKAVLAEAKIMAYIGNHENVVRFIGADVSNIAERKIILVTELSPHGDLLGYLRKVDSGKFAQQANVFGQDDVTPRTLVWWCEQIACGMQHLERKKIVHGDLAARNVLVFKGNTLKITDFGLSKQLYGNSEYLMKRERMLPWKWSALELLTKWEFSTDSDIWAFGVTAWEIFSLGRQPYEERQLGVDFIHYLEQGHRLPKPTYATTGIYKILLECWNIERSSRPRFATLREYFHEEAANIPMDYQTSNPEGSHPGYANLIQNC